MGKKAVASSSGNASLRASKGRQRDCAIALTAGAVLDGWYNTGDIAALDEEGFLTITDRLSRFSKTGGEMLPHLKVEDAVYGVIGEHRCLVTGMTSSELSRQLSATPLPRLWVPEREDIFQVDSIPVLGSGKIDLRGARALALDRAGDRCLV